MLKIPVNTRASFLRDLVYSANDGSITTFAIIAGSQGASLPNSVVLILGIANLLADGLSMASGNYLGVKTEIQYKRSRKQGNDDEGPPLLHGFVTFSGFSFAGIIPLIPYLLNLPGAFGISTVLVGIVLFVIGYFRGIATKGSKLKSGIEMLAIGGVAAVIAYAVGYLLESYVV